MAKEHNSSTIFSFRYGCYFLFALSFVSSISFMYWSRCNTQDSIFNPIHQSPSLDLLSYPSAWNHLSFSPNPPPKLLKLAVFVKKWPQKNQAGGLERHALTLHLALAKRGHEVHIFTTSPSNSSFPKYPYPNLRFHLSPPTAAGYLDQARAWEQFRSQNSSQKPFDMTHTESVGLLYTRARNLAHVAVSWHGIAYETIHSDVVQELIRSPEEARSSALTDRVLRLVEEVKFFPSYAHHVATSDHTGDVLKRIYMLPEERVHVILNGVDENVFKLDENRGRDFRRKFGVPESATLVIGMAGRLVKDKGHPIMFEALNQIFMEDRNLRTKVVLLVAGDGPWGFRYRSLGTNMIVLGPLEQTQLAGFYNALDIFANPTLRSQGLDHTLLEAMLSGKPLLATKFASIMESVIVSPDLGYSFAPTVASLKEALYRVLRDGKGVLGKKGKAARQRAQKLFTATKMAAAYERLFLCISKRKTDTDYCKYPHPSD
ncbi:hypothetical protein H6P81_005959 [Aristolochia fimbriata]|uniref:Glycosyltransferase subfamily 4-like N-terminal domain-containing protein n=1 Tax=Aristolochia fimbriata TaxID=158543 RepID=A0AAV7EY46_ARIFI|nr:hypothetical protein H6P81_005959 [Aristolochia fimbriata]